jgi:hypothetical protein
MMPAEARLTYKTWYWMIVDVIEGFVDEPASNGWEE